MITEIVNQLLPNIWVFAVLYIAVLISILADLLAGVRKAKKDGFLRSSKGLRRTVKKIAEYYNLMLVVSIIDIVQMLAIWQGKFSLPQMPFFSFAATIFLCIIELKSIYEKKTEKERADMEELAKFLIKAGKSQDTQKILEMMSDVLDKNN